VFQISEAGLTINGLIEGLKKASSEIDGVIVSALMKTLEGQLIEHMPRSTLVQIRFLTV